MFQFFATDSAMTARKLLRVLVRVLVLLALLLRVEHLARLRKLSVDLLWGRSGKVIVVSHDGDLVCPQTNHFNFPLSK